MNGFGSGFRADDLDDEEKLALRTAHDIYAASVMYTDEMLTEVTDVVAEAYDIINNQYGRMVSVLEEKAKLIEDNKAELMSGLRELSKEDRYSQIMELSQLLANELYNEKKRQRDIEEFEARQLEVQPEEEYPEDSAADEAAAGYEPEHDSAFEMPEAYEAENDSAFEIPENYEAESDSAFSVTEKATPEKRRPESEKKQDEQSLEQNSEHKTRNIYISTNVEKRILETKEVKDVDSDGVRVLRPVNQFKGKRDPVANTLNMFKRETKSSTKDGDK
jgi:hypothetical protein